MITIIVFYFFSTIDYSISIVSTISITIIKINITGASNNVTTINITTINVITTHFNILAFYPIDYEMKLFLNRIQNR